MTDTQHYRDRIAELEEEVRQLRAIVQTEMRLLELRFGLTPIEGRIVRVMARGGVWSRDKLAMLCCKGMVEPQVISVHICRIRRKAPTLQIGKAWGMGYRMEGESLDAVRRIIAGELPSPANASVVPSPASLAG